QLFEVSVDDTLQLPFRRLSENGHSNHLCLYDSEPKYVFPMSLWSLAVRAGSWRAPGGSRSAPRRAGHRRLSRVQRIGQQVAEDHGCLRRVRTKMRAQRWAARVEFG